MFMIFILSTVYHPVFHDIYIIHGLPPSISWYLYYPRLTSPYFMIFILYTVYNPVFHDIYIIHGLPPRISWYLYYPRFTSPYFMIFILSTVYLPVFHDIYIIHGLPSRISYLYSPRFTSPCFMIFILSTVYLPVFMCTHCAVLGTSLHFAYMIFQCNTCATRIVCVIRFMWCFNMLSMSVFLYTFLHITFDKRHSFF